MCPTIAYPLENLCPSYTWAPPVSAVRTSWYRNLPTVWPLWDSHTFLKIEFLAWPKWNAMRLCDMTWLSGCEFFLSKYFYITNPNNDNMTLVTRNRSQSKKLKLCQRDGTSTLRYNNQYPLLLKANLTFLPLQPTAMGEQQE